MLDKTVAELEADAVSLKQTVATIARACAVHRTFPKTLFFFSS